MKSLRQLELYFDAREKTRDREDRKTDRRKGSGGGGWGGRERERERERCFHETRNQASKQGFTKFQCSPLQDTPARDATRQQVRYRAETE